MDFVTAAREADAPRDRHEHRYEKFIFVFVATIVHEVGGHVFVTSLWESERRPLTPGSLQPVTWGDDPTEGESGRWLGSALFGGILSHYRNPYLDEDQVSRSYAICWNQIL